MSTQAPARTVPVPVRGARPAHRTSLFTRFVAVLAALMAVGHVWIMVAFPHGMWMGSLLGLMVLLCLKCAHRTWNRPAALVELLVMSALMSIAHTFMALGVHEHQHGDGSPAAAAGAGAAVMLAVAAAELVMVMLCGVGLRLAAPRSALGALGRH